VSLAAAYARTRPHHPRKVAKLSEYIDLATKHKHMILVDISGIPAPALHEIRSKLRKRGAALKVVKNKLFLKAVEKGRREAAQALTSKLTGQNAVIFTDENPFSLALSIASEYKMSRKAKPGDVATSDIVIPAGNTGIPPGPSMSLFSKLKVPIRVMEGAIWVATDTVVARKGEVVSPELAELLTKLNIKPIEITLPIKAFVINGRVVEVGEVDYQPEHYAKLLSEAQASAVNLAINARLPLPEVLHLMVVQGVLEATNLATALVLPIPSVIERCIARAHAEAHALLNFVRQKSPGF